MTKLDKLLLKLRKEFHEILDLDSYRQFCLELSMIKNLVDKQNKLSYKKGIVDCKRMIEERLETLIEK